MNKVLLIGSNGQVGHELKRSISSLGKVYSPTTVEFNLCDLVSAQNIIREFTPNIIINAAAYTAVDKSESENDIATQVNSTAPGVLAEEAKRINATLIHYSTDYVFDGTSNTPYTEENTPNPQNVYGRTKFAGEQHIQQVGGRYFIFRTSWVYGTYRANFMKTILRLAQENRELRIVNDQFGCPTWSRLIAEVTSQILAQQLCCNEDRYGLYHLTSSNHTNWFEFAKRFLELDPLKEKHQFSKLSPISTEEYPTPAKRPKFSALSTAKLCNAFGLNMPTWEENLALALNADRL